MEGVTILYAVAVNDFHIAILFIILALITAILSVVLIIASTRNNSYSGSTLSALCFCFSITMWILARFKLSNLQEYYEYTVTISDEVLFDEFTAKYEIIEQHGETYVVREKGVML